MPRQLAFLRFFPLLACLILANCPIAQGQQQCQITINPPTLTSGDPNQLSLSGTATNCQSVTLSGQCIVDPAGHPTPISVQVIKGNWAMVVRTICQCGAKTKIVATCAADDSCTASWSGTLTCQNPVPICPSIQNVSITNVSPCNNGTWQVTAQATVNWNGLPPMQTRWNFGNGQTVIEPTQASNTLTATATVQCVPPATITVAILDTPCAFPQVTYTLVPADLQLFYTCSCPTYSITQTTSDNCTYKFIAVGSIPCDSSTTFSWEIVNTAINVDTFISGPSAIVYTFPQNGTYTVNLSINAPYLNPSKPCKPVHIQVNVTGCTPAVTPVCPTISGISITGVSCNADGSWTANLSTTINWGNQQPTEISWNFGDLKSTTQNPPTGNSNQYFILHTYDCGPPAFISVTIGSTTCNLPAFSYALTHQDSSLFQLCTCPAFTITATQQSDKCTFEISAVPTNPNSCTNLPSIPYSWSITNSKGQVIFSTTGTDNQFPFKFPADDTYTIKLDLSAIKDASGNSCKPVTQTVTITDPNCNTTTPTTEPCTSNCPICQGSLLCCILWVLFIVTVLAALILLALALCDIGLPYTGIAAGVSAAAAIVLAILLMTICHYSPCDILITLAGTVTADLVIICLTVGIIPCSSWLCAKTFIPGTSVGFANLLWIDLILWLLVILCKALHS